MLPLTGSSARMNVHKRRCFSGETRMAATRKNGSIFFLPLALLACSGGGTIGDRGPDGRPGSTTGTTGAGGSGPITMTPDGGPGAPTSFATSRALRLSNAQWENTVQDLFRLSQPLGLSSAFVADPQIGTFDTYGGVLVVDANRFVDYQTAAETVAKTVA